MNMKGGQATCSSHCKASQPGLPIAKCPFPCLYDSCAEASLPGLTDEIADFAAALPEGHPLHIGIYFSGYSNCGKPSNKYNLEAMHASLSNPAVSGLTVYTIEHPENPCPPSVPGTVPKEKGCIVKEVFGHYAAAGAPAHATEPRSARDV